MPPPNPNAGIPNLRTLSLTEGRALLALYESMAEFAQAHDWDRLAEVERRVAAIRDSASSRTSAPLAAGEAKELAALLTRIQHLDHEIRHQLEPAHEQARHLLAVEVKGRAVREAYGSMESLGG
jgi:hypothetical protein